MFQPDSKLSRQGVIGPAALYIGANDAAVPETLSEFEDLVAGELADWHYAGDVSADGVTITEAREHAQLISPLAGGEVDAHVIRRDATVSATLLGTTAQVLARVADGDWTALGDGVEEITPGDGNRPTRKLRIAFVGGWHNGGRAAVIVQRAVSVGDLSQAFSADVYTEFPVEFRAQIVEGGRSWVQIVEDPDAPTPTPTPSPSPSPSPQ